MRLIYLSQAFYDRYGDCPEILKKRTRPYACLTIRIEEMTVAIPFRHHIAHKYAFRTYGDCGLDYTKAVVIADEPCYSNIIRYSSLQYFEEYILKQKD